MTPEPLRIPLSLAEARARRGQHERARALLRIILEGQLVHEALLDEIRELLEEPINALPPEHNRPA